MSGAAARTGDLRKRANNNTLKMEKQVVCKKNKPNMAKMRSINK